MWGLHIVKCLIQGSRNRIFWIFLGKGKQHSLDTNFFFKRWSGGLSFSFDPEWQTVKHAANIKWLSDSLTAVLILIARTFIIVPFRSLCTRMALLFALQWSEQNKLMEVLVKRIIWHAEIQLSCPLSSILGYFLTFIQIICRFSFENCYLAL